MLWDRQILLPSIARDVGGLNPRSLRSTLLPMSGLGQKRRFGDVRPRKPTFIVEGRHVSNVPTGDRRMKEAAN
jgi:hypothetical protein